MQLTDFSKLDFLRLPSPCFVVDEVAVAHNLKVLSTVANRSGAKALHALKAFSMWSLAPLTNKYLHGTCSSGLHEALLAKEYYAEKRPKADAETGAGNPVEIPPHKHMGGEIHVYAAGYSSSDLEQILDFADHVLFNSPSQFIRFVPLLEEAKVKRPHIEFGLRINPEHSEGTVALYDPCANGSRLGTPRALLDEFLKDSVFKSSFDALISGLHFHTLCEQGFEPLARTLDAVEAKFGDLLAHMRWLNFGGGHHITAPGYDTDGLIARIKTTQEKWGVQVYLEPGEAVAIGTGVLVATVLDITHNALPQAILDVSATCHMPDTLEMPYRADISNSGLAHEKAHTYRLGGLTCLAGDVIGDYSFDQPLAVGQRLVFEDMAHYTMVKTSTFNGTKLPAIAIWNSQTNAIRLVRTFGYEDFKMRLS